MLKNFIVPFLFLLISASCYGAGPLTSSQPFKVEGVDIRSKEGEFLLEVSEENLVLQERTFNLSKAQDGKRKMIAQGAVLLKQEQPSEETASLWIGDAVELKIGVLSGTKRPKQIVVLKLKNLKRTFVFELYR